MRRMRCCILVVSFFTLVRGISDLRQDMGAHVMGLFRGPGFATVFNVSSVSRIRRVAIVLGAFVLLGAMPVSAFAAVFLSPCAAKHHQCDAPSVERCCCIESAGSSVPATTEKGPELSAPAMVAPFAAMACNLAFVFPPEAWFRVCSRAARPPLPLHLLNVSILR